jgi:cyclopropane fatty-acyl-phospholipid synthase-like methyltransferase
VAELDDTRRTSFDRNAERYDAVRPSYPDDAIEHLIARSGIRPGGRILEVGAGTGKATLQFARRDFSVLAIEPGARMAALLRRKVAGYPKVSIIETTFEECKVQGGSFEIVVAAQAFHWVKPEVRYQKSAEMLHSGGLFAWMTNEKQEWEPELRLELDAAYSKWFPTAEPRGPYRAGVTLQKPLNELETSGHFEPGDVRTFRWTTRYTSRAYVDLLDTYSDHAVQPSRVRDGLYADILSLIDRRGGEIEIPYITAVLCARRS